MIAPPIRVSVIFSPGFFTDRRGQQLPLATPVSTPYLLNEQQHSPKIASVGRSREEYGRRSANISAQRREERLRQQQQPHHLLGLLTPRLNYMVYPLEIVTQQQLCNEITAFLRLIEKLLNIYATNTEAFELTMQQSSLKINQVINQLITNSDLILATSMLVPTGGTTVIASACNGPVTGSLPQSSALSSSAPSTPAAISS